MSPFHVVLLVAGILVLQAFFWFFALRRLKSASASLEAKMAAELRGTRDAVVLGPSAALYRGSDLRFGNVRGNGVLCLTDAALLFEKLTGERIAIPRAEIVAATVEDSFRGKPSFATGGKHLVIRTKDGNRIGFLLREAAGWARTIAR